MPNVPSHHRAASGSGFAIVAIGASAGGLEACRRFLAAVPPKSGMAFILVLHLDPSHDSMMVDLLAGHTKMVVSQASDDQAIAPDHLYVIPPGAYLSIGKGALQLSSPVARHGARMPFDFLLSSLAEAFGSRAACVVLSGTGTDGSVGLKAVKDGGGLVIAQDPDEAGYDGMPRSAIATGLVDAVLPLAAMPRMLLDRVAPAALGDHAERGDDGLTPDRLNDILDAVRAGTAHDFTLYKRGTLRRRVERRMGMVNIRANEPQRYLALLRADPRELDLLAQDLLINVTSFFRDRPVFDHLAATVIPDLLRLHPTGRPLRIWCAGCSTGEEAYSLAILFRERIAADHLNIKLQIFASDVDADAVATARDGAYPATIAEDVSPERLAQFFHKEDGGYRATVDLRTCIVFSVQDLLGDPPFSRLDMISCRNLLIYLGVEAQARVMSLFHFALNERGLLLLGNAETMGTADSRFEIVSKAERLFRHIGRNRPGDLRPALSPEQEPRGVARATAGTTVSRQATFAELCRRRVLDVYAPATILINRNHDCLYSLGPTADYLSVPKGTPSQSLLAMTPAIAHAPLHAALARAEAENVRVVVPTMPPSRPGGPRYSIVVEPINSDGEMLFLVFFEASAVVATPPSVAAGRRGQKAAELERDLELTRAELQQARRDIEFSAEEQKAINEEALSVNEEYQSTNEELLASKEELQSLNEELTALNGQLQETLDRQRILSDDLQNVLYSTDVATIFLDLELRIRFFTPLTRALFSILPGDVGRPLSDLKSLIVDEPFDADATLVLKTSVPMEREVSAQDGVWFMRRILPYRAHSGAVEGLVITFVDITARRHAAEAQAQAERQALRANAAKSRFLAAASHDLRQPLQTLQLIIGMLARLVQGDKATVLIGRLETTLGVMSGMLNTLLDINQIEAGMVRVNSSAFSVDSLLQRVKSEYAFIAEAQGLDLRVVSSGLIIESDPDLLEQMVRNLLSNALKYTKTGKILLGCRRRFGQIDIEIWDTGIGIAATQLNDIFDEYYQVDNVARQRDRGLGLGLSIVQRLATLLGHRVHVRSRPGKGSVFSIEIKQPIRPVAPMPVAPVQPIPVAVSETPGGSILIVEDDADIRDLLQIALQQEGHRVATAADGAGALELVTRRSFRPDVVLADFNLPGGQDGLRVAGALRHLIGHAVPVIILSGDIATETLRDIAAQKCTYLSKPVKLPVLLDVVHALLVEPAPSPAVEPIDPSSTPIIYVVDDDDTVRMMLREQLELDGYRVEAFASAEMFLAASRTGKRGCLLVDAMLPGMSGLALLERLTAEGFGLPAVMVTGHSDVGMAVRAMKAGAVDFIEKPIAAAGLRAAIDHALSQFEGRAQSQERHASAASHLKGLTPRQHQIMDLVLTGQPSKNIAADLGISQRTVENHRATIMKRTGAKSLPELARLVLVSTGGRS